MYHCTACDIVFEADGKARCPACFRVSTVEEAKEAPQSRGGRWKRFVAAGLAIVGINAALWFAWPSADHEIARPPTLTRLDTEVLDEEARSWHRHLLEHAGADEAAPILVGHLTGTDAARALSAFLQDQLALKTVVVRTGRELRRPPLGIATLADGVLASLAQREGAYLSATEMTLLIAALANQASLDHDIVLLPPAQPTLHTLPTVAVRFHDAERSLALDPSSGMLRSAAQLAPRGAELLWAMYRVEIATFALRHGQLDVARRALEKAGSLTEGLWLVRSLRAELLLKRGDITGARQAASGLAKDVDHPLAWFVEARTEAATEDGEDLDLMRERLEAIVKAFPLEAALAVELAELYDASGDYVAARDTFELALARDPRVAGAHAGLAELYMRSDPERAFWHAREELAAHADFAPAYLVMAALHAYQGADSDVERVAAAGRRVASDTNEYDRRLASLLERARTARAQDGSR